MAEDIRNIKVVLEELFKGRDAALEKYAKVRHTQYEIGLILSYNVPPSGISRAAKAYFSERFLANKKLVEATDAEISEGFKRLGYAVTHGSGRRCEHLVEELNSMLDDLNLKIISEPKKFLDWLTFDYEVRRDRLGNPVIEKPYGFEVRIFHDAQNRREFWAEISALLYGYGKLVPMQDFAQWVIDKRKVGVKLRD